jgi:hypothetical protein
MGASAFAAPPLNNSRLCGIASLDAVSRYFSCSPSAGITHVLFARPGTQLIEIRIPQYRRPHFISFSKIAGVGWIDMTPNGTAAQCSCCFYT